MRSRKKIINLDGVVYRDKQEALDHLSALERAKTSIHGLEIVILSNTSITTDMYKTIWFSSQQNVYDIARAFIAEKMGGAWNYIEFK